MILLSLYTLILDYYFKRGQYNYINVIINYS
jgi:hypothetical protein